jgi:hypothetical protein
MFYEPPHDIMHRGAGHWQMTLMFAVLPLRLTGVTRECWAWPNRAGPGLIPSLIHLRSRGFAWALARLANLVTDFRGPR